MTIPSPLPRTEMDAQEARRVRNAYNITLITGIVMALISVISTISTIATGLYSFYGIVITTVIAGVAFYAAYLARHGRYQRGVGFLVGSILVLSLALPALAAGQGLALGIIAAIIVSAIASVSLPPRLATRVTLLGILAGIVVTAVDLFLPDIGLPTDPRITTAFAALLALVYVVVILRRFNAYTLRTKLSLSFIGVALIPLMVLGVYNNTVTTRFLTENAETDLAEVARDTATRIDTFIINQLDSLRVEAQQPDLRIYLEGSPWVAEVNTPEYQRALSILQNYARKDSIFIRSYGLINTRGINVADTLQENIGQNESARAYFRLSINRGVPINSFILFNAQGQGSIFFTAPVRNEDGVIIGILRTEYNPALLQAIAVTTVESDKQLHPSEVVTILDADTLLQLASTANVDAIFKTLRPLSPEGLAAYQYEGRVPPGSEEALLNAEDETVLSGLDNRAQDPVFTASYADGSTAITAVEAVAATPWLVTVRRAEQEVLAPVARQSQTIFLVSLLLTALAAGAALAVTQIISSPVLYLTGVADRVSQGDLKARAFITTEDEIGNLAATFNSMTRQLDETLTGLEARIAERTADLQRSQEQSEKRAQDLQAITEIARAISSEQDLEKVLLLITRLISDKLDFYHVGIFLIDSSGRYAVLHAANSAGGQRMLARGHRLLVGQTGLVGFVAQSGRARISLDVGEDAVFFNNPDLPETRSEIALPLRARGLTVGVLDVQSTRPAAFSEEDIRILGVLADQVATAIENARLFGQTQQALAEVQALYSQNLAEEWQAFRRELTQVAYFQTSIGGRMLDSAHDSLEIRQAIQSGKLVVVPPDRKARRTEPAMIVPLKLRERVIGVLDIKAADEDHIWSEDEINMVQAVSDRLALALDNARLVSDSRRRADRERTISALSTTIGSSSDIAEIMQNTVRELRQILGASEVYLKMQDEDKQ